MKKDDTIKLPTVSDLMNEFRIFESETRDSIRRYQNEIYKRDMFDKLYENICVNYLRRHCKVLYSDTNEIIIKNVPLYIEFLNKIIQKTSNLRQYIVTYVDRKDKTSHYWLNTLTEKFFEEEEVCLENVYITLTIEVLKEFINSEIESNPFSKYNSLDFKNIAHNLRKHINILIELLPIFVEFKIEYDKIG